MLVSIVIPAYNSKKYLKQCLNSCINQTYKNIEIILVDDASSEELYPIAKEYDVKYIRNNKNSGPAFSRNIGIKMSQGELVSFIDADDIMHPQKIELSVKEFKDDVGMTCGNYKILFNRLTLYPKFYNHPIDVNWELLMKQNFVASGSTTVRKDVLEQMNGFNEEYWIAEDYDLWLRISERYKIKYIHDILYFYSIVKNGNSLTQREDIQLAHLFNIKKIKAESLSRVRK